MPYGETKVYFDGSHYVAIPHTETPRKRGRYKGPPKGKAPAKQDGLLDRNGNAIPPEEDELSDRKDSADSTSEHELSDRIPDEKPTEKEVFNRLYAEHINLPRKERKKQILEDMKPYFEDERTTELFVDANMTRKQTNLTSRRIRLIRKVNLQVFNYFVTFTYDGALHTEESFQLKLRRCLAHYSYRKGWKYIGVWERSPEKQRLHFHGLFYIPEGTLPGEMKEVVGYSFSEHKKQITLQNSHFKKEFGRNDFSPIVGKERIGSAIAYILKYIEKSGEKIVYSRGLPQFFISDILDDDVVCAHGLEDKKLLLFDDFSCFDEGCYVGTVSRETIKHMRKNN